MSITLPSSIFELNGQVVKEINVSSDASKLQIHCVRDKRYKAKLGTGVEPATTNRYIRRLVNDLPLFGRKCQLSIELAEMRLKDGKRRIEEVSFIDKASYYTKRFCKLISSLCRHLAIQVISKHFQIRWGTIKNIDKAYLNTTLPALNPSEITQLTYLGVDEVARTKGHDYMTVVYDLSSGQLIWVHEGRTAEVLSIFLKALTDTAKKGVLAVAMDMGPAYQKAVKENLPNADIVFDRFHVMQNFSRPMDNQRRVEFRRADKKSQSIMKGSRFLLLKNKKNLSDKQVDKLSFLLETNENINAMYILKEQLQAIWLHDSYDGMSDAIDEWIDMANKSGLLYLKKFAKSLERYRVGICNYAKHNLTTARIEAGNVAIGMIRKRARGMSDTEYFKLKIRQLGTKEVDSMFYSSMT